MKRLAKELQSRKANEGKRETLILENNIVFFKTELK